MRAFYLSKLVVCALIGIFSTELASAMTGNNTTIIPPPYPNSTNLIMHYNLTSPVLHPPPPLLATINVAFNTTTSSPIAIAGKVAPRFLHSTPDRSKSDQIH